MKQILLTLLVAGFIFIGCSENNSIVGPDHSASFSKANPNWITFTSKAQAFQKSQSQTNDVNWTDGGGIDITETSEGASEPWVDAHIYWGAQSWDNTVYGDTINFFLNVDNETCTNTFGPHMLFTSDANYSVTYREVDLTGVNPDMVEFVFQGEDGTVEYPEYDAISVDVAAGVMSVLNAKLPHFSRFGFINRDSTEN